MDPNNSIRLNKFISESGHCSRREADKLIASNRVKINGTR
ncbi:MAG: 23S rRNA pseudouridine synthase F, partial [Halieaceae bacterium]|nr:23S rRNA pseudouridine synthase F [Halieaceae bacterium]